MQSVKWASGLLMILEVPWILEKQRTSINGEVSFRKMISCTKEQHPKYYTVSSDTEYLVRSSAVSD